MTGGYVFTGVCPFTFVCVGGGVPHPRCGQGVPHVRCGGYPIPDLGGTPSQVWTGVPQMRSGLGVGYPPPQSRHDGVPPCPRLDGYPSPHPQSKTGWNTPLPPIRRQISKASTYCAAGGVPLAFTQEDFLVQCFFIRVSV